MSGGAGVVPGTRTDELPRPALVVRNARIVTFDDSNRVLDCGAVEVLSDGTIGEIREAGDTRVDAMAEGPG